VSILFVPALRRGNGSGHLTRCFALARTIQSAAGSGAVSLFIPPAAANNPLWDIDAIRLAYPLEAERLRLMDHLEPGQRFRLIVLDKLATSMEDYRRWSPFGTVVVIDEGGPARRVAPYVLDLLPVTARIAKRLGLPNCQAPGLLPLPSKRRDQPPASFHSILISFGGEDQAGLGRRFLEAFFRLKLAPGASLTLLRGPLAADSPLEWPAVQVLGPVPDLRERLYRFDLVVTHFGLTAYEAAWAGCGVLLLNPSRLHEQLARQAGFHSLGIGKPDSAALLAAFAQPEAILALNRRLLPKDKLDAAAFFSKLRPHHAGACPACGASDINSRYRAARKSYFACRRCGLLHLTSFQARPDPYTDSAYFFEDYKKQYGKTYLEDLPNLRHMARRRLAIIEGLLDKPRRGASVLDIGCAYGAFVLEAQSRDWDAVGTDVSVQAVEYVRTSCHVPAIVADFAAPAADGLYPRQLDCLAMWYVIEHFDELARVLRRVHHLLRPGGIFAFSTPSFRGVSGRRSLATFLEKSPDDHYTIWSPQVAHRVLPRFGFKVTKVVVTGHHPERFFGVPDRPASLRYKLIMLLSRIFGLGDTFECYAVKDDQAKPSAAGQ